MGPTEHKNMHGLVIASQLSICLSVNDQSHQNVLHVTFLAKRE